LRWIKRLGTIPDNAAEIVREEQAPMPIHYARRLVGRSRSPQADRHLGYFLAAMAGAINAVGFGVVGQYTSHMTGMVSTFGEQLVAGDGAAALAAGIAIATFLCGAACCTAMVHHARHRGLHAQFALPLLLEACLILGVAVAGHDAAMPWRLQAWTTICALTFAMGLQNALITKISRGEIRTTHVTGIVTDLGIEWGRALARLADRRSRARHPDPVRHGRARLLALLLLAFILGCIVGTFAVLRTGLGTLFPIGAAIGVVALVPAFDDLRLRAAGAAKLDKGEAPPNDPRAN
jgi:uncharacterized membrane protein YoaK (UPF0700 family)